MKYWLLVAYVLISLLTFEPKLHWGGDEAVYIILAEALVSGRGYCDLHLVGEPRHHTYPPGMAFFLSPVIAVFGRNLVALKLWVMLAGVVGYWFFMKIAGALFGCASKSAKSTCEVESYKTRCGTSIPAIFYLLTPVIYTYSHYALSEAPFTTCVLASVWFLLKSSPSKKIPWNVWAGRQHYKTNLVHNYLKWKGEKR